MPLPAVAHVLYLHGFASSARSSKAAYFAERLAPFGIPLRTPDFNTPDFENLTVTRMIGQVREAIAAIAGPERPGALRESVALIGSSLGGFAAIHAAAEQDRWRLCARIDRLVLLAPAVDFGGNRQRHLGEAGMARWKETDRLDVFHYGFGRQMWVRYALHEDAGRYDSLALRFDLPTLVFQGMRDESVDPETVRRWAARQPQVALHLIDDDHQLLSSLDRVWAETRSFFLLDHGSERSAAH